MPTAPWPRRCSAVSNKRASMHDGPLADLFRATDAAKPTEPSREEPVEHTQMMETPAPPVQAAPAPTPVASPPPLGPPAPPSPLPLPPPPLPDSPPPSPRQSIEGMEGSSPSSKDTASLSDARASALHALPSSHGAVAAKDGAASQPGVMEGLYGDVVSELAAGVADGQKPSATGESVSQDCTQVNCWGGREGCGGAGSLEGGSIGGKSRFPWQRSAQLSKLRTRARRCDRHFLRVLPLLSLRRCDAPHLQLVPLLHQGRLREGSSRRVHAGKDGQTWATCSRSLGSNVWSHESLWAARRNASQSEN